MIFGSTATEQMLVFVVLAIAGAFMSALFSGLETGVYSLSRIRLRLNVEEGRPAARRLDRLLQDRNHLLAVILIGNNVANYLTTLAITLLLVRWLASAESAEAITTLVVTPTLLVIGEMVPKNLFHRYPDRLTYTWSWFLAAADRLFTLTGLAPLVRTIAVGVLRLVRRDTAGQTVLGVREQVRGLLLETASHGTLSAQQTRIADNVLRVRRLFVADVMTPLARIVQLAQNATYDELLSLARVSPHARLLVHKPGDRRVAVGVLTVHTVLLAGRDGWRVDELMEPPIRIAPNTPVMTALARMQRERIALAVIADGAGRTVGIVTLKDVVEEIVGELQAW